MSAGGGKDNEMTGERRNRSPAGLLAAAVFCVGLAAGALLVDSQADVTHSVLVSLSPPVVYTQANHLRDYSIKIPSSWKPGTKLGVQV